MLDFYNSKHDIIAYTSPFVKKKTYLQKPILASRINRGTDEPAHPRSLTSVVAACIMCKVLSITKQAGLCCTCSESPKIFSL